MPLESLCHFKINLEFDCTTVVIHIQIRKREFQTNFRFHATIFHQGRSGWSEKLKNKNQIRYTVNYCKPLFDYSWRFIKFLFMYVIYTKIYLHTCNTYVISHFYILKKRYSWTYLDVIAPNKRLFVLMPAISSISSFFREKSNTWKSKMLFYS